MSVFLGRGEEGMCSIFFFHGFIERGKGIAGTLALFFSLSFLLAFA